MLSLNDFAPISQISTNTMIGSKGTKDVLWTTDIKKELPIFMTKDEYGSLTPITMMEMFEQAVKEEPKAEALFFERKGEWQSWTWNHYYKEVINFAKALINLGIEPYKTVNILGFNSPEWFSAFLGGQYACVVPTGVYLTNNSESCVYIAEHSECGCLVLDSVEQFKKFEKDLNKLKSLKAVVFYCDLSEEQLKSMINPYVPIFLWKDFVESGRKANIDIELNQRRRMQKPGNCCNIVYTSGTTGHPKAVLLSHDNMTWTGRTLQKKYFHLIGENNRIVSYLPLSHIAGQMNDIICAIIARSSVYFARPDALSGSLLQTLHYVRPTEFFAVPRVYEKFEERIREQFNSAGFLKKKISTFL
jgi:long-chain-fatty-acid--CoA ligase ACSBG